MVKLCQVNSIIIKSIPPSSAITEVVQARAIAHVEGHEQAKGTSFVFIAYGNKRCVALRAACYQG